MLTFTANDLLINLIKSQYYFGSKINFWKQFTNFKEKILVNVSQWEPIYWILIAKISLYSGNIIENFSGYTYRIHTASLR